MVESPDHLGDHGDDLRVRVSEDGAHLAAREVEHTTPRGILDEGAVGSLGDERRPRRPVAHEVTSQLVELSRIGHRPIIAGPMQWVPCACYEGPHGQPGRLPALPAHVRSVPDPPAAAAQRPPRRPGGDLGQARGLQLGHRLRRQQGPQAGVPDPRGAGPGVRHAGVHRRRPVEPHPPGHRRRRAPRPQGRHGAGGLGRLARRRLRQGRQHPARPASWAATCGMDPAGFDIGIREQLAARARLRRGGRRQALRHPRGSVRPPARRPRLRGLGTRGGRSRRPSSASSSTTCSSARSPAPPTRG